MIYYVYVLQSIKTGRLYIGFASDLRKRFKEHNQDLSTYTKGRGPFTLIYPAPTQKATAVKLWMNAKNNPEGKCPKATPVKAWCGVYYEACLNKLDAMAREKYLKSGMGKRYIKNRLKRFLPLTG